MQKNLVTVVAVRKGSQRVPNKNLESFCGKNLLIHKIEILKKIKELDEIIINTDSEEAITIARDYKISYFRREDYFASSKCTNSEFWSNVAKNTNSKYIMFTHCTNPLVKVETYIKFIETFKNNKEKYDSFNTVTDVKEFLFIKSVLIIFLVLFSVKILVNHLASILRALSKFVKISFSSCDLIMERCSCSLIKANLQKKHSY